MRLNVGDFIADTTHLSCEERGAYIALIMHYWRNGGLPDDDERLARIVGLDAMRWQCVRIAMLSLFRANWRHKRIDEELAKAAVKSAKATLSANNRWKDKVNPNNANALRAHRQRISERNAYKTIDIDTTSSTRVGTRSYAKEPLQVGSALSEFIRGGGK
jgi:uncharacterized protein YdaU (DUF1376 family)